METVKTEKTESPESTESTEKTDIKFMKAALKQAEKAERFLYELGFTQFRVRIHGEDARIEIPQADFEKFIEETFFFQEIVGNYILLNTDG